MATGVFPSKSSQQRVSWSPSPSVTRGLTIAVVSLHYHREEFAKVLAENPLLYDIFAKNTLPGLDEAKHIFADARKKYGKATSRLKLGNLQHVYQNYFKKLKDTQSLEISLVDFRRLMRVRRA